MTDLPETVPERLPATLPEAERPRWQPLRLGLIELYHYDVEEFRFRDGHLLLRGNNGTGKSKVLSLTLPFLLDANLNAPRVEPDGDRNKRMEWNLLMGGRYDRRIGYTWIEFGRRDEGGRTHTLTLGCGLRAVAGRSGADAWFFITEQRVGKDLWLTTNEHRAISRERLIEAIGTQGQVYKTAQDYRRAADERLFRLGTERYAALVDTLIQLRQPQLSKQPNEQRLSDALTQALAPLDRAALDSVAEAMGQLEDLRRELDELGAMRDAVASFGNRYRRYAQVATRRKARVLRQAQTEHDSASRELNAADEALEKARASVERWRAEQQRLDEALVAGRARLDVLQADPVMRDARRIADARERAVQCRTNLREAEERIETTRERLAAEERGLAGRRRDGEATRADLAAALNAASAHAASGGLADEHTRITGAIDWPDGIAATKPESIDEIGLGARAAASRRREQLDVVRQRLGELDAAERKRDAARGTRDQCADAFDEATETLERSIAKQDDAAAELLDGWRRHAARLRVLVLDQSDALLGAFERWLESLDGVNPMRAALDSARETLEETLAAREAALAAERETLVAELDELRGEQARLVAGEDRPPPAPYTRGADVRADRPGAPLWQLVDFAPAVAAGERAGIEAALEAAGLLDAWVTPGGVLLEAGTHDVVLVARKRSEASLADWLVPAIAPDAAGSIEAETVAAVLSAVACYEQDPIDAEAWVSPAGEFRIGAARGAWTKPRATYVGHAAREAARRARLDEIAERIEALTNVLAARDASSEQCAATRQEGRRELVSAPADDALLRAAAERGSAESQRRAAQTRLGEAEARLSSAEQNTALARERLANDARDLRLPSDADGVERIEHVLADYRTAAVELVNAARNHKRSLAELEDQERRARDARQDADTARENQAAKSTLLREADETVAALEATVGKQVEELLADIETAKAALERDDKESKRARAELNTASAHRGTCETDRKAKELWLAERAQTRRTAIANLQAFTAETDLLAIATSAAADFAVPDTGEPWGVDAALTIARRAEQTLAKIGADDAAWERVRHEIGRDLTDLQNAMSARGHSATAEPSDHGLVVRIVHQQRPVRPDVLQEQLDSELAERKLLLSERERAVLEQHLEKEIAANLQRMIQETDQRVVAINEELARRPTSTGVRYRLVWQPVAEDAGNGVPGLTEARKRLLKTSADAWSPEDRRQVGEFLQARISAETADDEQATMFETLDRALDYRRWHRFRVQRLQDGQWRPLSGPASSGERALGLTVPLFAACSSHYESADPNSPRLVLLDEAFAGIDDDARANCMALIREFDLDFIMTSEREWGCYPELPGLSICQLVRREGIDAVFVSRWRWDGAVRRVAEDLVQRFPSADVG